MLMKAVVVVVVAVSVIASVNLLNSLDVFQVYFKHHPGTCSQVKGLNFGSEDLQTLSSGLTFVTSGMDYQPMGQKFKDFLKKNDVKGRIYLVDLNKSQTEAKEVKIKPSNSFNPSTFRPHGLSVLEDKVKGKHLLYVINHCDNEDDRVDKFRYLPDSGQLEHVKSFTGEQIHITNDLALTGEDTFYISDYLYYKSYFMHIIEQVVGLRVGSIQYFNGSGFTAVATGVLSPNGVMLSKDKRYLYVSTPLEKQVKVYEVTSEFGLRHIQDVKVHTSVDNLHLSEDGNSLYGGCHPVGYKVVMHLDDPSKQSPSQVIHLPLKDGKIDEDGISQIFYDHGDLISASTVATVYKKKLLIGSIINKLVVCDLP